MKGIAKCLVAVSVFLSGKWVHAEEYYLPGDCFYASWIVMNSDWPTDSDAEGASYVKAQRQLMLPYSLQDDTESGLGGYRGFDRIIDDSC